MLRHYLDPRTGAHPFDLDDGARPPHIVYLTVDMIPREAWDPESPMRRHLRTPGLDRLIADGTLFTHACTTSPLCGPSRAATLTGRYPYLLVNEERAHDGFEFALRPDDAIFPEYLRAADWLTAHAGKCHVGAHKFLDAFGENATPWDRWAPPMADDDGYLRYLRELGVEPPVWREPIRGVRPDGAPGNSYGGWITRPDGSEFPEQATYSQYLAWRAGETLASALHRRGDSGAPVYLQLDFFAPHQPFMVPTCYEERAREFIAFYESHFKLEDEILKRINFDEYGYFDNSSILYDTQLLNSIATRALERFENVNKVLTSETDGIPIACHVAQAFDVDMVFTRKEKEVGRLDYVEETYIPSSMGKLMSLYLPKRSVKKGERLLIVDDVIRSGETQRALLRLAKKMNAEIAGLFGVVSIGEKGTKALENELDPDKLEILVNL